MLPGISQEGLWALVRLVTNSMTVTDLKLRKGLNLTNANLNLSNMANGTSLLYIRRYRLKVVDLINVILDWDDARYQPRDVQHWHDLCNAAQDVNDWVYVRYVGQKLIGGTRTCNLLVTASVRIDHQSGYPVEIGPFTVNFKSTPNTSTYLDSLSLEATKKLLQDDESFRVERGPLLPQFCQLQLKLQAMSTYTMCCSSSPIGPVMQTLPYTIWTLYDYDNSQATPSQEKIGSRLFQMVATAVVKDGPEVKLKKQEVEMLMNRVREDCSGCHPNKHHYDDEG
ncbi:hypothetical protein Unana1_05229 [Umbelopsis nana]